MKMRAFFLFVFALLTLAGGLMARGSGPTLSSGMMVADLHVHPFPGDGSLTPWQLQQEASRRGLDLIAIAGHNNRVALTLARALGLLADTPIVIESQELTSPGFHIVAVGVREMIDWQASVPDAVQAIHSQGGVAIAAHPVALAWKPLDEASLAALDGVEVAHPMAERTGSSRRQLDAFYERARAVKPAVAPIGSTDFHGGAPLGLCRTFLLTGDRSAEGALAAIKQGRTVAQDQYGRLYGTAEHIGEVERLLPPVTTSSDVSHREKGIALAALAALAVALSSRVASTYTPRRKPDTGAE